jgi:hypothetical protein
MSSSSSSSSSSSFVSTQLEFGELTLTIEQLKSISLDQSLVESQQNTITLPNPDGRLVRSVCVQGCILQPPNLKVDPVTKKVSGSFILSSFLMDNKSIKIVLTENTVPFCVHEEDVKVGSHVEVRGSVCHVQNILYVSASFVTPMRSVFSLDMFYQECMKQTLSHLQKKKKLLNQNESSTLVTTKESFQSKFQEDGNLLHFSYLHKDESLRRLKQLFPNNFFWVPGSLENLRFSQRKAEFYSPFLKGNTGANDPFIVCFHEPTLLKQFPDEKSLEQVLSECLVFVKGSFQNNQEDCAFCIHQMVFYHSKEYQERERKIRACQAILSLRMKFFKQQEQISEEEDDENQTLETCFGAIL